MESSLANAVLRLLKPLVRILIRHGGSYGEFRDLARRAYVETAEADFQIDGRRQTMSRIAMLTGIQRKEVSRLLDEDWESTEPMDLSYNRGVRVISGWQRDSQFLDDRGSPAPLSFDGGDASFSELVRRHSGDLTARAVLDELERVGAVRRDDAGVIHLISISGYVPTDDEAAQFNILGSCVSDLLGTLDHNLVHDETRLQLTTAYNNLPRAAVDEFRELSKAQSLLLLKQMDTWLAEHDRDVKAGSLDASEDRYRAGVGIYYIEEQIEDDEK